MERCTYYSPAAGGICQSFHKDKYWQAECPFKGDLEQCEKEEEEDISSAFMATP